MVARSKVLELPDEVKCWLDCALVENNFGGYQELERQLNERGFVISRSSLQRYGSDFSTRLSALKMASEQAKAIVTASPDDEGAVNEALMRLVQEHLFKLLMSDGEMDLPKVARAVAELSKASVVQKKWASEVRTKAEAAANDVEKLARKEGLSDDTVQNIRKHILGVAQ